MKLTMVPLRRKQRTPLVDKQQPIIEGVTVHPVSWTPPYLNHIISPWSKKPMVFPARHTQTLFPANMRYAPVDGTPLNTLTSVSCLIACNYPLLCWTKLLLREYIWKKLFPLKVFFFPKPFYFLFLMHTVNR